MSMLNEINGKTNDAKETCEKLEQVVDKDLKLDFVNIGLNIAILK